MGKYFSGYTGGKSSSKSYTNDNYGYGSYGYGWDDDVPVTTSYGGRYGSSYGSGKSGYKTSYGSGSSWNWGNFGYTSIVEDSDDDLFINNHESYFTPKDTDISKKLKWHNNTAANRKVIKEYARFFFHKMIDDKNYFDEKYNDESKLSEHEVELLSQKKQIYDELWDKYIPGFTPLEQAVNVFNELIGNSSNPEELTCSEALDKLNKEGVEFHEEIYKDPEINELLDMHEFSKDYKFEIIKFISMIKNLGSEFKIEKEIEERIVPNSRINTKKIMRDYSQVYQADLYQRLLPTFDAKLLTKSLVINTPIDKTEHKQKIIILLDYSGSMGETDKQQIVVAMLVDRLRYAMKGEAEIFFSYFVHDKYDLRFTHIHDRKSALDFWATFSTEPNGGDTHLGEMVNHINSEINDYGKLCNLNIDLSKEKPEILAINDGQDSVKTKDFPYKTNAISLIDGLNEELKELCLQNDGKYVYVHSGGHLEMFSNNS